MTPELLLSHFDRISDAPDAVPRLRQFVRDLAVRGKLVEQHPEDESASKLICKAAKNQVRGKAGKWVAPPTVKFSESDPAPFLLPSGWTWIRLGDMCSKTGSGSTPRGGKSVYVQIGVPFLRSQNIHNDGLRLDDVAYITETTHEKMSGTAVQPGDLLLNITGGSIGRCCLVSNGLGTANISQHVAIIRSAIDGIQSYLHELVLSTYFQSFVLSEQTGAGRGGLPKNKMDRIPVALPPLPEQRRIIAKVDELMILCDCLEEAQHERDTSRDRLTASTLHHLNKAKDMREPANFFIGHFPHLASRPDQINQIRQTILNLAIRGKLSRQDSDDEPASELLKYLKAEKKRLIKDGEIRPQRPLPPIQDSGLPFPLPCGWVWTRLGDIAKLVTSGYRDWAKYYSTEGAIFLRMGNLSRDSYRLRLSNIQRVKPPTGGEGSRTRLEKGDILISITGEVGLLGLIPSDFGEAYINQHTCLVRPMEQLADRFLPQLFCSPFAQNQFDEPQRGLKNSFRRTDVMHFLVPLPPLAEQQRIVVKVDELLALCDRLETELAVGQREAGRLLESLLFSALNDAQSGILPIGCLADDG